MSNYFNSKKIVFFGTPLFALPVLEKLFQEGYKLVYVVTQANQPVGRRNLIIPTPIRIKAQQLNIPVTDKIENSLIEKLKPVLGIVAAFGQIIPKETINLFPDGCLNVHPSLLPKYRGPSPIQAAILNNDLVTGVTIIKIDEQLDHGPTIAQQTIKIQAADNFQSLSAKLFNVGAELLVDKLPYYLSGKLKPIPQNHKLATYTKILKREDGKIDWSRTAKEIEQQIKAYFPWPGSYFDYQLANTKPKKLKIISARTVNQNNLTKRPGEFYIQDKQLYLQSGEDSLLVVKIQPEGKSIMSGEQFINGYLVATCRLSN